VGERRVPRPFDYRYCRPPNREDVYHATLLAESDDHLVLTHVVHPRQPVVELGSETVILEAGSSIVWFLFKGRPYDVGRFYLADGTWTGYYVDITEPVSWQGADAGTLQPVTDLFLDIWIAPDGRIIVLDEDELEEALQRGWITREQHRHTLRVRDMLLAEIEVGTFPPEVVVSWDRHSLDS
jgi:predicted RNA-binding protein associated with RNAse of E/G family